MYVKKASLLICFLCFSLINIIGISMEKLGQEEHQLVDKLKKEMAPIVHIGPLALANLNLNQQGNVIAAEPGEKIFGMLNFHYDFQSLEPESLNQIVIGFSDVGAQKCIFNELGYRCNEGIASFFLQVPHQPGIYEVQCRFEQAYSPRDAIGQWSEDAERLMTVGKIIVRD
jgi:hypothetical protein